MVHQRRAYSREPRGRDRKKQDNIVQLPLANNEGARTPEEIWNEKRAHTDQIEREKRAYWRTVKVRVVYCCMCDHRIDKPFERLDDPTLDIPVEVLGICSECDS